MKKLVLDELVVESFATVDVLRQARGTVQGRQQDHVFTVGEHNSCHDSWCNPVNTCDPSCQETRCVTACQGGSQLTS